MKAKMFFLAIILAVTIFGCQEEEPIILKTEDDIILNPPKPPDGGE